MAQNHIFIVSSLQTSELLYFSGRIKPEKQWNKLALSNYSRQICKTRFLILDNCEIIASPVFMRFSEIHIIASKKYIQSGDFANYISKFDIALNGPHPLTLNIYNECLNYTLICKLSPEWNKLDKYFVKSFNFLTNSESFEGVRFEARARDEYFIISIKKDKLLLPLMKTEDIEIDLVKLKKRDIIPVQKHVYLLPQFIPGKLVSISKNLPNSCLFKTYSDIRLYWRNMYGYHLPTNSDQMLYAQVLLNRSDILYIYPFCCMRSHAITQIESDNSFKIINDFLITFMKKCLTLCGKKLEIKLQPKMVFSQSTFFMDCKESVEEFNIEKDIITKDKKTNEEINEKNVIHKPANKSKVFRSNSPSPILPRVDFHSQHQKTKTTDNKSYIPTFTLKSKVKHVLPSATKIEQKMDTKPEAKRQKFDIDNLARTKNLHKATIAELLKFCKEHAIQVRAKDKKNIILSEIYRLYGMFSDD